MAPKRHSVEVIKPEIQIDEQLDLHEKGWIFQRLGWVFIFLVMLVSALGMFGEGPLSRQTPTNGNVKVQFDRFYRYEKEMQIKVESGEAITNISFPQHYLKHFRIVRIVPEPKDNEAVGDLIQYNFQGVHNKIITAYMVPEDFGKISGHIKVNNTVIPLHHFLFP